jgi:hypothetical protein
MIQEKTTVSGSAKTLTAYKKIQLQINYTIITALTKIKFNGSIIYSSINSAYTHHITNKFSNNITLRCFLFGGQNG